MARLELIIDNMHCGACIRRVTQTLNGLRLTHADRVALGAAAVSTEAPPAEVVAALTAAGFPARITAGG